MKMPWFLDQGLFRHFLCIFQGTTSMKSARKTPEKPLIKKSGYFQGLFKSPLLCPYPLQRTWRYHFAQRPHIARYASEASFFLWCPLVRPVFGLRQAIFVERSGGVAAIVCDTTENTVRQGYCYACLATRGGVPWSSIPWSFDFPWSFLTKEIPWCFECFLLFFLCFFRVFIGIERGKNSLVFWMVFLGFYLNTKEWKIRVPLGTLGLHFIILFSGNYFSYLFHLGLHQTILAELFLVICRICISCLTSHDLRNHYIRKFWGNYFS